jgi:PAS domain-containing protein
MLHDFIPSNNEQTIDRARGAKLEHGIPLFSAQLADPLVPTASTNLPQTASSEDASHITDSAARRGDQLLKSGFMVAQVVQADVLDDAIAMLWIASGVSTWNRGATRVYGYSPEAMVGVHFSKLCSDADVAWEKPQASSELT